MSDLIDGLHGKPNSTRVIVYKNKYDEDGLLIGMTARSEIVYCKDCEHYDDGLCRRWKYSHVTSEESFCSGAERREE